MSESGDQQHEETASQPPSEAQRTEPEEENDQKAKQFFKEELKRLQKSLDEKSSKIKAPPIKEHVPYCFNALEPYYNTVTAVHVIEKTGDDGKLIGAPAEYSTRQTAIGLVDPWVDHKMDKEHAAKVKVKDPPQFRESPKKEKKVGEGSTMIPVFPTVKLDTPDLESRQLNYSDVPMLRKELKEKYSSQGKAKIEDDYKRTKVDFYRMELHKLNDVHPVNRGNMTAAYFAYLQNTPGSKKALKECYNEVTGKGSSEKGDSEKASTKGGETPRETPREEETSREEETPRDQQETPVEEA